MRGGLLLMLAALPLFGQATPPGQTTPRLEFEVASIKPSATPTGPRQVLGGMHIDSSQVNWTFLSLKDYIVTAYRVRIYQISGPDWLGSERFDINAKLPEGASPKDTAAMLQTLLEDRFQLKVHREQNDFAVYGLVVGKGGLKIKESAPDLNPPPSPVSGGAGVAAISRPGGVTVNYSNGASFTFADNKFEGHKLPFPMIADVMARFTDRPVVDMTATKGNYAFSLELSPEDFRAMGIRAAIAAGAQVPPQVLQQAETSGDSLANALDKLGLKLEPRKAPIETLIVDHAEKTPSEN
ncbi:MAG TPA: TIGR03435 family protein [Bryobacteraceae bacterium]|nr:TIGR03435 family protein [Bryobacteraceae bacterium]